MFSISTTNPTTKSVQSSVLTNRTKTCTSMSATRSRRPGAVARYDYTYERNGTRNLFMMSEPLTGWRHVDVTKRRRKQEFAEQMRSLVDEHYPDAIRIRVVLDNLSSHQRYALYEFLPAAEANRVLSKLEFHFTPEHGSLAQHGRNRIQRTHDRMPRPAHS